MPNLELSFHVHSSGFSHKKMRRSELIGHRDKSGKNNRKFTKEHLDQACRTIQSWMKEYNAMIDKPEPAVEKKCDSWACLESSEGCKCHD